MTFNIFIIKINKFIIYDNLVLDDQELFYTIRMSIHSFFLKQLL